MRPFIFLSPYDPQHWVNKEVVLMKSHKYMCILIKHLAVFGVSCAAIGYLLGVMVSESMTAPSSIGADILFIIIASVLAILSLANLVSWIKFLLERYMR